MGELGVKLTGPVSSWNLDSGKSNIPGFYNRNTRSFVSWYNFINIDFVIEICISQNPILRRRSSWASPMNNDVICQDDVI
jgi:hypothetical protein